MSLEDGSAYNERLILLSRGDTQPDRNVPVEWITYDLWNDMRSCDKALAEEILEPVFTFMRAQTDKSRLSIQELGEYLRYRERDVGKALVTPTQDFFSLPAANRLKAVVRIDAFQYEPGSHCRRAQYRP